VARDRVGDIGAVTRIQRSNTRHFFAITTVYVKRDGQWVEEFDNGEVWPEPPTAPRPEGGRPIAMLTGTSGAAVGPARTNIAFTAGVATTAVARLRVRSTIDEHEVHVDERTGIFAALTVHTPHATRYRIVALDPTAREVERIDYQDPWSTD
jgi:hypothetical protein